MGRSAAESVTDGWGRVHGLPWLRVADASLFPDSLEINSLPDDHGSSRTASPKASGRTSARL